MEYSDKTVAICMATYNGEKYIEEQIQSIIDQTYRDWVLFIHDDGSQDDTVKHIQRFLNADADRKNQIILLEDTLSFCGSAKDNFAGILDYVKKNYDFSYFMFADQDDVWLPNKIRLSMEKMLESEKSDKSIPILVHTDLKVVDEQLKVLGDSFIRYRALNPRVRDINHLLAQNNVTGCTMLWNKPLNDVINLGNPEVAMHDWWFSTSASLFGQIEFVDEPTVLYRQHDSNTVGATKVNTIGFIVKRLLGNNHVKQTIQLSVNQAQGLLRCYGNDINRENYAILEKYATLYRNGKIKRCRILIGNGYLKQGIIQRIGQLMYV